MSEEYLDDLRRAANASGLKDTDLTEITLGEATSLLFTYAGIEPARVDQSRLRASLVALVLSAKLSTQAGERRKKLESVKWDFVSSRAKKSLEIAISELPNFYTDDRISSIGTLLKEADRRIENSGKKFGIVLNASEKNGVIRTLEAGGVYELIESLCRSARWDKIDPLIAYSTRLYSKSRYERIADAVKLARAMYDQLLEQLSSIVEYTPQSTFVGEYTTSCSSLDRLRIEGWVATMAERRLIDRVKTSGRWWLRGVRAP